MPIFNPVPGVPGPTGTPGQDGDPGEDSLIPGPQGIQGTQGLQGSQGVQGVPGVAGDDGLDGDVGPVGPAGATGSTGATGAAGTTGNPGSDGLDGEDGLTVIGPQGSQGLQGIPGIMGEDGLDGDVGPTGPQGATGATGSAGSAGAAGSIGPPGTDGVDGEDSMIVPSTIPGPQGVMGYPGLDGETFIYDDIPQINIPQDSPLEPVTRIIDQNLAVPANRSTVVVGPVTINAGNQLTIASGGRFQILGGAPTLPNNGVLQLITNTTYGTTSTSYVMEGLSESGPLFGQQNNSITLLSSGAFFVSICGYVTNSVTLQFTRIKINYGTGTPPKHATAEVGTSINPSYIEIGGNTETTSSMPFCITGIVTGLSLGIPYWIDLVLKSSGSGNASLPSDLSLSAFEL